MPVRDAGGAGPETDRGGRRRPRRKGRGLTNGVRAIWYCSKINVYCNSAVVPAMAGVSEPSEQEGTGPSATQPRPGTHSATLGFPRRPPSR